MPDRSRDKCLRSGEVSHFGESRSPEPGNDCRNGKLQASALAMPPLSGCTPFGAIAQTSGIGCTPLARPRKRAASGARLWRDRANEQHRVHPLWRGGANAVHRVFAFRAVAPTLRTGCSPSARWRQRCAPGVRLPRGCANAAHRVFAFRAVAPMPRTGCSPSARLRISKRGRRAGGSAKEVGARGGDAESRKSPGGPKAARATPERQEVEVVAVGSAGSVAGGAVSSVSDSASPWRRVTRRLDVRMRSASSCSPTIRK